MFQKHPTAYVIYYIEYLSAFSGDFSEFYELYRYTEQDGVLCQKQKAFSIIFQTYSY